jgi:hypothetical protein
MPQSRTLDVGVDGLNESMAVAYSGQEHGAEVSALGLIGTRQGDIDDLIRKRPATATPLVEDILASQGEFWVQSGRTLGMSRALLRAASMLLIRMETPSSADHRGAAGVGQTTARRGGDLRRFGTTPHQFYGGVDLHARPMVPLHPKSGRPDLTAPPYEDGRRAQRAKRLQQRLVGRLTRQHCWLSGAPNAIQHRPALVRQCRSSSCEALPPWLVGIFQHRGH